MLTKEEEKERLKKLKECSEKIDDFLENYESPEPKVEHESEEK